jgi:hypothetical protein
MQTNIKLAKSHRNFKTIKNAKPDCLSLATLFTYSLTFDNNLSNIFEWFHLQSTLGIKVVENFKIGQFSLKDTSVIILRPFHIRILFVKCTLLDAKRLSNSSIVELKLISKLFFFCRQPYKTLIFRNHKSEFNKAFEWNWSTFINITNQIKLSFTLGVTWAVSWVVGAEKSVFGFNSKVVFFQMLRSRGAAWREHRRHLVSKYFHFSFLCFESLSFNIVFLLLLVFGSLTLL